VAKNNHIQVDLLYRYLPAGVARWSARAVDVMRIAFFGAMSWLTVLMMQKMGNYQMTIVDLPMNIVYGVCLFGFVAMTARSVWVARVHWQRGYSVLERPETHMGDR
jgi:TRAP-type transport system small permease protein